jgi:hypothetical protein
MSVLVSGRRKKKGSPGLAIPFASPCPDGCGGVRGIAYAKSWADEIKRRSDTGHRQISMLSRQSQYRAVGTRGNVADGMRFLNREDFTVTPTLGEVTGEAFCDETELPGSLLRAVVEDTDVPFTALEEWANEPMSKAKSNQQKPSAFRMLCTPIRSGLAWLACLSTCWIWPSTPSFRYPKLTSGISLRNQIARLRRCLHSRLVATRSSRAASTCCSAMRDAGGSSITKPISAHRSLLLHTKSD